MVEHQLPKLNVRVRFSLSAPIMVLIMRKKVLLYLLLLFSAFLIAMYFIPWYKYMYSLPGIDENGEEVITSFVEWWSPFYEFVFQIHNIWGILFFVIFIFCPIVSFILGICSIKNERYKKGYYILLILSITIFFFMMFIMIIFSPKM